MANAKKISVVVDPENYEKLEAYAALKEVSIEEGGSLILNTGLSRHAASKKYADKKAKEARSARRAEGKPVRGKSKGKAAKAEKAKAAAKPAKAAAKPAKAKAAAKSIAKPSKAKAKPAKAAAAAKGGSKKSPLAASSKKANISRLAPQRPAAAQSNGIAEAHEAEEAQEAAEA